MTWYWGRPENTRRVPVEIQPHGEFTFDNVPETFSVIPNVYLDIGMALGKQPVAATDMARAPRKLYDILPDVTFEEKDITALAGDPESGYDKENFYAADSDVNVIGPRSLGNFTDWSEADIEEIESTTGPFIASSSRSNRYCRVNSDAVSRSAVY